jgi:peptide/nickel transport system ATP-binding protein
MHETHDIGLEINHLSLSFPQPDGWLKIVQDLNLYLIPGKTIGLIGESGCGKSMTALSILRLLPLHIAYGKYSQIVLDGENLLNLEQFKMRHIRGKRISMVFQEPMLALNPVRTMYQHVVDVISAHQVMPKFEMNAYIFKLMDDVELGGLKDKVHEYPHQWSGGQKQRFLIAMALANKPDILLADEPTTALDLVVQKQIIELLKKLQQQYGLALLLISHDFNVVKTMADYIVVMYAGQVIEHSPRDEFWERPLHPYVHQLLNCVPRFEKRGEILSVIDGQVPNFYDLPSGCRFHPRCSFALDKCRQQTPSWYQIAPKHQVRCHLYPSKRSLSVNYPQTSFFSTDLDRKNDNLLEVSELWVAQNNRNKNNAYLLKDIKFNLERGTVLAVVGESGSGKSTLANTLMGLIPYQKGKINLAKDLLPQEMQLIFQDPSSAMNPRWSIQEILSEGLLKSDAKKLLYILDAVQMPISCLKHYPHELSGGQRQRIAIARGLLAAPKLLICDEPTSALDISVQAQILNLLQQLKKEMGLSYILITHDLDIVGYMADHVLILKDGEIVEQGLVTEIWNNPKKDYTKTLLASCE